MNQQYHSKAAYISLRTFFDNHLPAIRTLQMWFSSIDGAPGISQSALDIIREKSGSYLAEEGHEIHLTLIYDDMSIRKGLFFSNERQEWVGQCTYINTSNRSINDGKRKTFAKEALFYMIVGPDFKLPIAYELCAGLEGIDRAALTLRVIAAIESCGARVISLTGDGLSANLTAAEKLGAKFNLNKPYFQSPTYPHQKIYIILDPPHMLKLIRKQFSTNRVYHNGQLVNWSLLETLVNKQSKNNFNLCNKLTNVHIKWEQKPMNVRLAAETISNSVADVIEQLDRDGYEEFTNSEPTVTFIRFFNAAYDILNFGENKKKDDKFKQKLCPNTARHIFEFAETFKSYISELEIRTNTTSKPALECNQSRGFFGFYYNFISLQGIYEDFVLNGPLDEFFTFQFNQDHLETFFSLIR